MQFGLVSLIRCPWIYFLRAYHLCSSKSDIRLRFWSWYDLKKLLWPSWTQHSGLLCLWQCLEISFLPSTSLHTAARHKGRQSGAIKSHFPNMRGKYVSIEKLSTSWTNEKLSLMAAWSSSVLISCYRVPKLLRPWQSFWTSQAMQPSVLSFVCPCLSLRTPWIVKSNNPLSLVWSKWGSPE